MDEITNKLMRTESNIDHDNTREITDINAMNIYRRWIK